MIQMDLLELYQKVELTEITSITMEGNGKVVFLEPDRIGKALTNEQFTDMMKEIKDVILIHLISAGNFEQEN